MIKMQEFELLSAASNAVVARHLDRNFPGLLIQGDTLKTFLDEIEELNEEVIAGDLEAVKEISNVLRERFIELLTHYENVLEENGRELPYMDSVIKKIK